MTQDHTAVEQYLRNLESELQTLPDASRVSILDDVNAHIVDALEEGRGTLEVLAGLGKPDDVARDAREQLGAPSLSEPSERAAHTLNVSAVALAVITAAFVSFLLPSYASEVVGAISDGTESTLQTPSSLFETYGIGIALLPLLPALLALLPLLLPRRMLQTVAWVNAGIVTVFSVIDGFSIGWFFVPLALLMWAAALVPRWIRRGRPGLAGHVWRAAGALGIIAPMVFAIAGLLTGTLTDPQAVIRIVALVTFAIGIAFLLKVRFLDITIAAIGAAIMVLAMVDTGILTLAVWWGGGFWLVTGLSAIVTRATAGTPVPRTTAKEKAILNK